MKTLSYIILLFSFGALLQAQDVAISYEITPQNENQASMQVYLQSLTDQDQTINAINFSLALPEACVKITGQEAIFSETWTDFLQKVQMKEGLDLNYNNWHYTQRWQYGSADPGLPTSTTVLAPAQEKDPLLIMKINLEGSCTDMIYLEQEAENPVNQMGDENVLPIEWTVFHPKTELELSESLQMEVFPNPVADQLNVSFEGIMGVDYQVQLSTIDGKMLESRLLKMNEGGNCQFKVDHLPSAVYILSVTEMGYESTELRNIKILKK